MRKLVVTLTPLHHVLIRALAEYAVETGMLDGAAHAPARQEPQGAMRKARTCAEPSK